MVKKQEAFNLEKEAKIINPHRMESSTQNQKTYIGHIVPAPKKELRKYDDDHKPILGVSSY